MFSVPPYYFLGDFDHSGFICFRKSASSATVSKRGKHETRNCPQVRNVACIKHIVKCVAVVMWLVPSICLGVFYKCMSLTVWYLLLFVSNRLRGCWISWRMFIYYICSLTILAVGVNDSLMNLLFVCSISWHVCF